ncbi:GtrA family protein [Nocardioides sp.]|uniref:GtrA family protein n=1 Tax=Nocardioides sp. TaxID=35761 RepID=UPI0031FF3E88|nr:GtrA family protein [Nocardioides sp.]
MTRHRTARRFAAVGVVNTLLDTGLFMLLHGRLGVVGANFVSTSAGMAFSFVANGVFTFGAGRLTLRHAALFVATTGVTMWLVQPLVIRGLLGLLAPVAGGGEAVVLLAKLLAIGVSVVLNFAAYRWVVWPVRQTATV